MGVKIEIMSASESPEAVRRGGTDGEVWTIRYPPGGALGAGRRGLVDALCWLSIRRCTNAEIPPEGDRIPLAPSGVLLYPVDQHASGIPEWVDRLFNPHMGRLMQHVQKRPLTERDMPSCAVVLSAKPGV
jgi:hypothetical protein